MKIWEIVGYVCRVGGLTNARIGFGDPPQIFTVGKTGNSWQIFLKES